MKKLRAHLASALSLFLLCAWWGFGTDVRFAVISDTHVGSGTAAVDLRSVVQAINKRRDIECVFVTGDITEKGRDEEFAQAKEILSGLRLPWVAIPGNHDAHWIGAGLAGFAKEFGRGYFVDEQSGAAFFLLTSGEFGHLDPQEVEWLAKAIARVSASKDIFVLLHHPPADVDNWAVVHNLIRLRPSCVVAGHVHRGEVLASKGIPVLTVRASKAGAGKGPGFSIIEDTGRDISLDEIDVEGRLLRIGDFVKPEKFEPPPPQPEISYANFGVNVLWHSDLRRTLTAPPTSSRGSVFAATGFAGGGAGTIVVINASDGRIRTNVSGHLAEVISRPVATEDGRRLYAADVSGRVFVADTSTGSVLKTVNLGERITSPLVLFPRGAGGARGLLAGTLSGRMYCLDSETLEQVWVNDGAHDMVPSCPLVVRGRVVYGSWDAHLHCLDAVSGKQMWAWTGNDNFYYSPAGCVPCTDGDRVFACSPDGTVSAVSLATGRCIWRENHDAWESLGISEDRKRLFAKSVRGEFLAIDAESGKLVQKISPDQGMNDTVPGVPVAWRGNVFYGRRDGKVYMVDGRGTIKPLLCLGAAPIIWVESLGEGVLAAANADGTVVAFKPQTEDSPGGRSGRTRRP